MDNEENLIDQIWFMTRWFTGYVVDVLITIGGASAMVWSMSFYNKHPIVDIPLLSNEFLANPLMGFGVGIGMFSAFMAGRQWVRTQYFHHVLPEVWNDAIKKFVNEANDKK